MGKFKFKSYCGCDKYHFRIYRGMVHPFIVTEVNLQKGIISGFLLTHKPVTKRGFTKLYNNPNPIDKRYSYIQKCRITDVITAFSRPYNNWHLCKADQILVENLEKKLGLTLWAT